MMNTRLGIFFVLVCGSLPASAGTGLWRSSEPWTSPYRVDPNHPFHLVNAEGRPLGNEAFPQAVGEYFRANDPHGRPVCTSDGTTDDAAWPDRTWIDLAINHTCTSSSNERHDLRDWYLALARNTRSHGKPAWCNESGRENRRGNNDGVHRRKQGWLWCTRIPGTQ